MRTIADYISALGVRGFFNWMSDKEYLKILYFFKMGKKLNLKNPQTYSEKLQWLKINDQNPLYTTMVDKSAVKQYVSNVIGEEYIIPTLGVWKHFDEIDFDTLPNQFVLKCNHDSGGIVICSDKNNLNKKEAKKKLENKLKKNFFFANREWPYKDVQPRIIAEQYMEDAETSELRDYKFFCFNGKVKFMFIATDRQAETDTCFDFFDSDFNWLDVMQGHPNAKKHPQKPDSFEKMKELAQKLANGIPQVRVDFYEVNGRIYFGEMTFFHFSGMQKFIPERWDEYFGSLLQLPEV